MHAKRGVERIKKEEQANQVIEKLRADYPEAATRLHYDSLFQLLVAVILSAQSTDDQVNRVTPDLFKAYPDAAAISRADIEDLEKHIRGVGLYHNKARHLREMAGLLVERFAGEVPGNFEQLMQLPGVGRKTANVVIAVGFGGPGLGVDTHVHRVANRLGLVATQDRNRTEKELKEIIPLKYWNQTHHLFIWHGRQVCKARRPNCSQCNISHLCSYHTTPSGH